MFLRLRLILLGLSLGILLLLALELGLRAGGFGGYYVSIQNANGKSDPLLLPRAELQQVADSVLYNLEKNILLMPDRRYLYRVAPLGKGKVVDCYQGINREGFRDSRILSQFPKGEALRILIAGDSCAFGFGLCLYEDTLGPRLEAAAQKIGLPLEAVNISQPGHSSELTRRLASDWLPKLKPDLLIVESGWNDIWYTGKTDQEMLELISQQKLSLPFWLENSALFTLIRKLSRPSAPQGYSKLRVPLERSRENFRAIAATAKEAGVKRVLLLPPIYGNEFEKDLPHPEDLNSAIKEEFGDDPFVDLVSKTALQAVFQDKHFLGDGYHPSPAGVRLQATLLAARIKRLVCGPLFSQLPHLSKRACKR